ncbi:hypothetical protein GHT06_003869 [Daphnia sinensis]|uniref:Uncharacterized protein n=1 Tax=Daphnia sinensis TaxID=1820382 RepID=A0AAD5KTZ2_9CRUS|nr:hypothetical protein GHT06_003869 [Daphnia sinensis]
MTENEQRLRLAYEEFEQLVGTRNNWLQPDVVGRYTWTIQQVHAFCRTLVAFSNPDNVYIYKRFKDGRFVHQIKSKEKVVDMLSKYNFRVKRGPSTKDGVYMYRGSSYIDDSDGILVYYGGIVFDPSDPDPKTRQRNPSTRIASITFGAEGCDTVSGVMGCYVLDRIQVLV